MSEQQITYLFGPFSKENYNPQKWKHIKEKIYQLNSTNEEQTIPDCRDLLQLLLEINNAPNIDEYFGEPSIKNFFFNDFILQNAKNLIATKTFNNNEILELSNRILEEMTLLWLRVLNEDNAKLAETVKYILDPARSYFKCNNQEETSMSVVSSFLTPPPKEHLEWIKSLKEGDVIDCIKIDPQYKKMCWSHAKIIHSMESHFKVSFLNEKESLSRYLEKTLNANEMAPYQSKCKDFDWRLSLKEGDEIDCCDTSHVWYNATVLKQRENTFEDNRSVKEIFIGYRIYNENGDKTDTEGRKFFGWSAKYDEWLSVTSPRIAPKNKFAKKLYLGSSSNNEDPVIEDSNDKVYCVEGKTIYAITRPSHCKSIFLVNLVNKIGELGGFQKILDRLNDTENWAPIEVVSHICAILGNIHCILHRDFALEYIPKFKDAVWRNILKSPDSNLRNFTKERIDTIIQAFDPLLKRIVSLPEKYEALERFNLEISLLCFDSNFLERKLQGLKSLLEIIKNTRYNSTKYLTTEILNKFIVANDIFDKIYGSKGHVQLVQRSADFLKYMINESSLDTNQLALVWNATTKGDVETKLTVYKVLSDIALHFKNDHLDFLIKKIGEIAPSDIIPDEIELVYEMSKYSLRTSGFTKKARDFYWNIITDSKSKYSNEILDLTLNKFCDIMKTWELKDERINVLYMCVDNVQNEISVLGSIKIMKKLIEHYSNSPASSEKFTKSSAIEHLCKEKNLLPILIHELKTFKSAVKAKVQEVKDLNEAKLDSIIGERATYLSHISERLQFIYYVLSNSDSGDITLTYELLSELWDVIVTDALVPSERDVIYKWVKETAESKTGFPMSSNELLKFFKDKMNNQQDCKSMTLEGFNCFKNMFLVINEKLQRISKNEVSGTTVYSSHSAYGTSYHSYSYEDSKAAQDFEYKVNVLPEELEGIQSIWNFIMVVTNETVVEKAIDFLNKIYLYTNTALEDKIVYMREEYLTTCIKHLKELLSNKSSLTDSAFVAGCMRCLTLIRSIMDESEKKGIGNLKSHSGLVKGEVLNFHVTNDVTSGVDVPKKVEIRIHSNATVFELRREIGRHFKATWDQIKLTRNLIQREIRDNENGKTIGEIRIKNGETLSASKRATPAIPQANLIEPDGSLNPLAKKIFVEWFTTFSEDGKMSPDHCAAFIHSCTGDYCKGDDKRVKEVFATYDDDKDGYLSLENFLDFYHIASKQRAHVVWSNLHAHQIRNDLKKASEVEEEKIDIKTLPRYILSTNEEYFSLIFSLLDFGGKIAIEAWKLLNRLPTSPKIFADVVTLKGVRETADKKWELILDPNSAYKMLYALHVIEYLMEDDEEEANEQENHLYVADPKFLEYKKNWRADFIIYGGFDHLFKIFNHYALKDHKTLNVFDKNILSFILKILKDYLAATFASTVPHLYRNLSFIRLFHLSLSFINDYMNDSNKLQRAESVNKAETKETTVSTDADMAIEDGYRTPTKDQKGRVKFEGGADGDVKIQRKDSKAEEKKKEKMKIEESEEFKILVERLRGDLGNHIIATINLKNFLELITNLGYDILTGTNDLESEDRTIMEHSLSILTAILLYDKKNIYYFLNINEKGVLNSDKYLIEGIFCSKAVNVRKYFSHALYILCKNTTDLENSLTAKYLISLFLKNLPSSEDENKKDCLQYFELLCALIEEAFSNKEETEDSLNFEELITLTINQIKNHSSTEVRNNLNITDKIFTGLLQLCEKLLIVKPSLKEVVGAKDKHNLVEEIFTTCLFDIQERDTSFKDLIGDNDPNTFGKDYVKCKSKDSRTIAYKLLDTLCKDSPANTSILMNCLQQFMSTIQKANITSNSWNYSPSSDTKSFYGYVGIKNLGCICYMNAMLQQFFMTPSFRYGILMADDKKPPNLVPKKDCKHLVDDNVLHQLQQMFGFLELSDRQAYNPHEFCFAFKDHAGQPVNVSVQQDTQEFLNMIFDKLERELKHTPLRHITDSIYGGKTSNQLICHGCGYVRERIEGFYNMSVEVKNLKNLYESMDKFITGETIDDYYCDNCNKKNSITKRTCISYLPNVLIVHLQRIVFDLDTLMNQKINSRLEFPFDLNMEPYTKEGLEWRDKQKQKEKKAKSEESPAEVQPQKSDDDKGDKKGDGEEEGKATTDTVKEGEEEEENYGPYKHHPKEYYEYKLAGVVVHVGVADAGHYYSYINTNRGDPSKKDPSKSDRWLEFNDSSIRDFDTKNIESECFGGASSDSSDDAWAWAKAGRENSKNAYILVYERVVKDPLKLVVQDEEDEAYLNRILELEKIKETKPDAVKIVPEEITEGGTKKTVKNYYVDYYTFTKRFVPAAVYKKVWEDNHKFMFERHIFNEDFFKFIKDVTSSVKLPDFSPTPMSPIYADYHLIPQETVFTIKNLVIILSQLIYNLLARASENSMIGELAATLRKLLSLVPDAATYFFDKIVCKGISNVLELMINSPEKHVRYHTSQLILHSINVMIAQYKFELDINKIKATEIQLETLTEEQKQLWTVEDSIIKFLNLLITLMPNEVAKNWIKCGQFFEFWRDFAASGEPQMSFLYQKEFIAVLIDFMLEKRSPIPEFSEKKHSMGSKYADPEFGPIIQTIAIMIRRARMISNTGNQPHTSLIHSGFQLYDLSGNDQKCLYCADFYDKVLREKFDPSAFGVIIQHLSFENDFFSRSLATIILRGLNRANSDEAKAYLEAITNFLRIPDYLQPHRIEWVFGFPQPVVTTTRSGPDSFGLYGNGSLDDVVISYESPLGEDGIVSLINHTLQNRKRLENVAMVCLKTMLNLADTETAVFEYLFALPPPSYNYGKFMDWIMPFIDYYIQEAKRYSYSSTQKEESAMEALKLYTNVNQKVEQRIEYNQQLLQGQQLQKKPEAEITITEATEASGQNEEKPKEKTVIKNFLPNYIIGESYSEEEIERRWLSQPTDPYKISFVQTEVRAYITESKPVGDSNLAFPQSLITDCRLKNSEVLHESPLAHFIQPRTFSKFYNEHNAITHKSPISNDIEAAMQAIRSGEIESEETIPILDPDSRQNDAAGIQRQGEETTADTQNEESNADSKNEADNQIDQQEKPKLNKGEVIKRVKKDAIEINSTAPCQEDFHFTYEINPVIRRFIIMNDSPHTLTARLILSPKTNDFVNFRIPLSTFHATVRARSNYCITAIMKIYPEMDWGEYEVHCDIIKHETNPNRYDSDSGRKKVATFNIRPIDTSTRDYITDDRGREDDFASYYT